jgi:phosphatidylserine/phosphatidylglycerophosphate/cardiolipin synthase-like enzyme
MNVSLRAVHNALHRSGDAPATWRRFAAEVERRSAGDAPIRLSDLETVVRELSVRGSATEWLHNLRTLGVIRTGDSWSSARADDVATALDLVADSFDTVGPMVVWVPVATLPIEIREHLHPPVLRQTAGVLLELIDGSTEEVLLATPFVDAPAIGTLADSLLAARRRGVDVAVVTSVGSGGVVGRLASLQREDNAGNLRITEVRTDMSLLGSHAKVLVADRRRAYVGSANMTVAGFGRNVEVGVEVQGPQVADLARLLLALERVGTRVLTAAAT